MYQVPFNKPYFTGKETTYIQDAVASGKISGNGKYTKKCQNFFEKKYGIKKALMTTSCTDALEMAAILINIKPGDEVIMPSYTFVSTANAFIMRGAKIIFIDSKVEHPGIDESKIEAVITPKAKAIVPVHYAGVACNMDAILKIANKYNLFIIEDCAQAVESYYTGIDGKKKSLGTIGHIATFSFHETKNIISGEGGLLAINDERFIERAEIIWEKGTNRSAFFRGEVNKYSWIDIGSSFLPSEIIAAFLWAQLENISDIQERRKEIWNNYNDKLKSWTYRNQVGFPFIPSYASNNAHMFYLIFQNTDKRNNFIQSMKSLGILCVFHYISLHSSEFFKFKHDGRELKNSDLYSKNLVRLPFFYELNENKIISTIINEITL